MRKYANLQYGDEQVIIHSLASLSDKKTGVEEYRQAFYTLGKELGKVLASRHRDIPASAIMLVCASEDADWLANGVETGMAKGDLKKSVYWSSRETVYEGENGEKIEIAPIEKSYEEPIGDCQLLVIVKSIISTSCVVKTQLTRLIGKVNPGKIAIVAPVMYVDGEKNLRKEFPEDISRKFEFLTFAIDDERLGSEVLPGIGGWVYPRLGLGGMAEKNTYIPKMVLERI
mgnify:FL=1